MLGLLTFVTLTTHVSKRRSSAQQLASRAQNSLLPGTTQRPYPLAVPSHTLEKLLRTSSAPAQPSPRLAELALLETALPTRRDWIHVVVTPRNARRRELDGCLRLAVEAIVYWHDASRRENQAMS